MRVNKIQSRQNFGMPIDKDSYLGKMHRDYLKMYDNLSLDAVPPYRKHITEMASALQLIDEISPNYDIGIYPDEKAKRNENQVYPSCFFLAFPLNGRRTAVKISLPDSKYPLLEKNDLMKIAAYVKLIEDFEIK